MGTPRPYGNECDKAIDVLYREDGKTCYIRGLNRTQAAFQILEFSRIGIAYAAAIEPWSGHILAKTTRAGITDYDQIIPKQLREARIYSA